MDFKSTLNSYINIVEEYLHSVLDGREGKIYEAMRYSLYSGGKRIRPVLTLACSDALGGDRDAALAFGCAIEMIHTYSLIHDDLPCMDDDDIRRGKPTNHIVFGEDMAVLAGDALLNMACESVLGANLKNPERTLTALKVIFNASGAEGMIGGQVLDMDAEVRGITAEELKELHYKKTGALIRAAASLGAISSGCDKDTFDEFASSLGLAFQIRDDILDVEGNAEILGKPISSDEKNNKTTYVTLYGLGGAKEILREETENAINSISFLGEKGEFLKELAMYLLNREK